MWGLPKRGKSHFALTFPKPLVAIEIGETGIEDLLYKHEFIADYKSGAIIYKPITLKGFEPTLSDHKKLLVDFQKTVEEACKSGAASIVIDSMSRLGRSIRLVKTDEAHEESERKKRNRADFELVNEYTEQIIQYIRYNGPAVNLVLVHRHKEVFAQLPDEGGVPRLQATGRFEARDYPGMENIIQTMVRAEGRTKEGGPFMYVVELCRFNPDIEGRLYPNLNYDKLMEAVFA